MNKTYGPHEFERYSFLWSEIRLVIAAVALLIGGRPVLAAVFAAPSLAGLVGTLLTLSWIISGVASAYLAYRWWSGGQRLFGGKDNHDLAAFAVSVISGLNLGWTGLFGSNPGMSISSNYVVFVIVALLYIVSARHLLRRWQHSGERIFS